MRVREKEKGKGRDVKTTFKANGQTGCRPVRDNGNGERQQQIEGQGESETDGLIGGGARATKQWVDNSDSYYRKEKDRGGGENVLCQKRDAAYY